MSNSLENQFISDTYPSLLHTGLSAIPLEAVIDVNDGSGQKTALSLGLSGQGATITGQLTSGNIEYPENDVFIKFVDWLYPVGSIILSVNSENPATRFTGTTWTQVSEGRFIVGAGTGTDKNNVEKTFTVENDLTGEYSHTISSSEIPDHYHYIANSEISQFNSERATLSPDNYLNVDRNSLPAFGVGDYRLNGTGTVATVGRTSGVVRESTPDGINSVNPSYGVYIWKRTN